MAVLKLTKRHARKVLEVVDRGLSCGMGDPKPGKMCVEAAVCYALGLPHGDEPPCVGSEVRDFKIALNDCNWSSKAARARGMRKLAIAQLGSRSISQMAFRREIIVRLAREFLPLVSPSHKELILGCKRVADVRNVAERIRAANTGTAYNAAQYFRYATLAGAGSSSHAVRGLSFYTGHLSKRKRDALLCRVADIALRVLVELKSPGCRWLDLTR